MDKRNVQSENSLVEDLKNEAEKNFLKKSEVTEEPLTGLVYDCTLLNLRQKASIDSKVKKILEREELVDILGSVKSKVDGVEWLEVNSNGTSGFVMKKYISEVQEE